jgi:putative ABC transport system ATP-binding protein
MINAASADTTAANAAMVRAEGCTRVFGDGPGAVTAVSGASLTVHKGELVALVGPSGSGKTTLLSMLGALLSPTTGRVFIGDVEVTGLAERERTRLRAQRIGFVFQSAGLLPYLTAVENVATVGSFAGLSRRRARRRAEQLLDDLGLADRARHLPKALSGGEQQRVAVARALLNDPPVLLADEPTAHLDGERGRQVVSLITDAVRQQGRAGVVVTHDDRVAGYADRVLTMADGRLVSGAAAVHPAASG